MVATRHEHGGDLRVRVFPISVVFLKKVLIEDVVGGSTCFETDVPTAENLKSVSFLKYSLGSSELKITSLSDANASGVNSGCYIICSTDSFGIHGVCRVKPPNQKTVQLQPS